ncbi:MAG: aspartate 1-decarboxylase [Phycisphaerae bacterium]
MKRYMLKSKLHRARLTGTELDYEGSITIDRTLLEAADMLPGEQVHVLNLNNGSRIVTYIIEAPAGSGTVLLNGPAARTGQVGDKVIVLSYCELTEEEARGHKPNVVLLDEDNKPTGRR